MNDTLFAVAFPFLCVQHVQPTLCDMTLRDNFQLLLKFFNSIELFLRPSKRQPESNAHMQTHNIYITCMCACMVCVCARLRVNIRLGSIQKELEFINSILTPIMEFERNWILNDQNWN